MERIARNWAADPGINEAHEALLGLAANYAAAADHIERALIHIHDRR